MITQRNFLKVLFAASVIFLASCSGKDGDPGPGYAEAVKYGNVKITLSGQRPTDNVTFKADQDYKYYSAGNNPDGYSSVYTNPDTKQKTFYIERFLGAVDEHTNDNYVWIRADINADTVTYYELELYSTVIDGTKFFGLSEDTYLGDNTDSNVSEIKDFKYDAATGKVKFTFNWTAKNSNSTGHDLTMTGAADVTVFEGLNSVND